MLARFCGADSFISVGGSNPRRETKQQTKNYHELPTSRVDWIICKQKPVWRETPVCFRRNSCRCCPEHSCDVPRQFNTLFRRDGWKKASYLRQREYCETPCRDIERLNPFPLKGAFISAPGKMSGVELEEQTLTKNYHEPIRHHTYTSGWNP